MKSTNGIILIFILLTSISLRFFNYFDIPFTYDEFSAFFRLNFDSFSELIEKGVKIDGHPAGIHVFLYYWTMLFGSQVWIVKFPFTILGVLSVFLVYIIGKKWFNETVGLLSAAYLGSIQMTVMYSQIARPYISGLFFSLVLINYWTNLMKNPERDFNKNSLIFILSASLCAYNHHFSLLFAAMVGITGVFIVPRRFLPKYLFSGLVIFALYVPHLKIFFYQLAVGGVGGWLGKPHNDFLFEFIFYVFNFSPIVAGLALVIILFGLFHLNRNPQNLRMVALSFAWFIIPFLIGFYYSRYVNAVLQYSVLIFSLPLLFFALFGFIKEQSPKIDRKKPPHSSLTGFKPHEGRYSKERHLLFCNGNPNIANPLGSSYSGRAPAHFDELVVLNKFNLSAMEQPFWCQDRQKDAFYEGSLSKTSRNALVVVLVVLLLVVIAGYLF